MSKTAVIAIEKAKEAHDALENLMLVKAKMEKDFQENLRRVNSQITLASSRLSCAIAIAQQ